MSRVAEGHFRRKREAPLIVRGKHVTIQGPSPYLRPAWTLAASARMLTGLAAVPARGWCRRQPMFVAV
jgi:hypothetical protein